MRYGNVQGNDGSALEYESDHSTLQCGAHGLELYSLGASSLSSPASLSIATNIPTATVIPEPVVQPGYTYLRTAIA